MWVIFQMLIILLLRWSFSATITVPDPKVELVSINYHDYEVASTDFDSFNGLQLLDSAGGVNPDYTKEEYDESRGNALKLKLAGQTALEAPGDRSAYLYPNDSSTDFNPDVIEWKALATTLTKTVAAFRVCVSTTTSNTVVEVLFNDDGIVYMTDTTVAQNLELFAYQNETWYDFRLYIDWENSPPQVVLMGAESGNSLVQLGQIESKSTLGFFKFIYIYNYDPDAVAWVDDVYMWDAKDYTITLSSNVTSLSNIIIDVNETDPVSTAAYMNYNDDLTSELSCDGSQYSEYRYQFKLAYNETSMEMISFDTINSFRAITCFYVTVGNVTTSYSSSIVETPQYNVRASIPYFTTLSTGYGNVQQDDTEGLSQITVKLSIDDRPGEREGYIYYMTNGTDVVCDQNGTLYDSSSPLDLDTETIIYTRGCRDQTLQSRANTSNYYSVKNLPAKIILKSSGIYVDQAELEIICQTSNATVIYTTGDGFHDPPTCDWDFATTYWPTSGNLSCTAGGSSRVTLGEDNAIMTIVCRDGNIASNVTSMSLIILDSGMLTAIVFGCIVIFWISLGLIQGFFSAVFSTAKSKRDEWDEAHLRERREQDWRRNMDKKKRENKMKRRISLAKSKKSTANPLMASLRRSRMNTEATDPDASAASTPRSRLSSIKNTISGVSVTLPSIRTGQRKGSKPPPSESTRGGNAHDVQSLGGSVTGRTGGDSLNASRTASIQNKDDGTDDDEEKTTIFSNSNDGTDDEDENPAGFYRSPLSSTEEKN